MNSHIAKPPEQLTLKTPAPTGCAPGQGSSSAQWPFSGLLGPRALAKDGPAWIPVAAAALLLGATVLSVFIVFPVADWHSVTGTKKLLADYIESEPASTMAELGRSLARYMEEDGDASEQKLISRNRLLVGAGLMVVAETILWLLAIAESGGK